MFEHFTQDNVANIMKSHYQISNNIQKVKKANKKNYEFCVDSSKFLIDAIPINSEMLSE